MWRGFELNLSPGWYDVECVSSCLNWAKKVLSCANIAWRAAFRKAFLVGRFSRLALEKVLSTFIWFSAGL